MNLVQNRSDILNTIQSCGIRFHSSVSQMHQKYNALPFNAKVLIGTAATGTLALTSLAAHQYMNVLLLNAPRFQDSPAPVLSVNVAGNTTSALNDKHSIISLKDQIDSLHVNTSLKLDVAVTLPKSILPIDNGMCPANHSMATSVPLYFKEISTLPYKPAPKPEVIAPAANGMCPANHSLVSTAPLFIKEIPASPHKQAPKLENSIALPKPEVIAPAANRTCPANHSVESSAPLVNNILIKEEVSFSDSDDLLNLFKKQSEDDKYETITKDRLETIFGAGRDLTAEQGRKLYNKIAKLNLEFGMQALNNPQISEMDVARAACETRHNTKVYIRSRLSECMQQASEHIDWIRHKNITGLSCEKIMGLYKNNATKIVLQAGSPNNDVNFIAETLSEDMFCKMPAVLRDGLASTAIKPLVLLKAVQKGDVKGVIAIAKPEAVSDVVPATIYTTAAFTAYKMFSFGVRGLGGFFNHFRRMP